MTALEFDLLDELYFVISFEALQKELNWETSVLKTELTNLLQKGWVKYINAQTMIDVPLDLIQSDYQLYLYLATKQGLLAHHSKD
jgi:hypothetical protein